MIKSMNHTQVPNEIVDLFMRAMTPNAFKVVIIICRKTFGWHKETDSISISQIMFLTGLSRSSVLRSVKELEDMKIIIVDRKGDGKTTNKYTINYEDSSEQILNAGEVVSNRHRGSVCETPVGSVCETPTKETNKKKLIKKEFQRPSVEEVKEYVREKGYSVNPLSFHKYYTDLDWCDMNGNKVKNWKGKLTTWQIREDSKSQSTNTFKDAPVMQSEYADHEEMLKLHPRTPEEEASYQAYLKSDQYLEDIGRTNKNIRE